jgi:carboxypeptidase family protein
MTKRICLFVTIFILAALLVFGQTGVGQLQGTISDRSGAVVPGAMLTLEHVQTGNKFQTISSEVGFFLFPSLQPGEYRLTASVVGMDTWQGQVVLQVGQTAVVNPVLQVGRASQEVTVVGDVTPLVSTSSATVSTIVERERIDQLPINGRSIQTLLTITVPGLEGSATQPKVYGLRDSAMDIVQDGVGIQDRNTGAIQSRPPGLDTVQAFRVETSVSSAKLDRPASAILTTRSGTNELHGSIFETGRNSGFGVARRREDNFSKAPHLVRNEFGASLGGPVSLPGYNGKNRTFFFGAWEEYRLRQATTTASRVWTEAMRRGDFSGLIDSAGRPVVLYDPWSVGPGPAYSKTPFPNNQLPISKMSPLAKYVFSVTSLPTEVGVNPLVADNFFGPSPTNIDQRSLTFRGDHRLSDKDQIFGRYSHGLNDQMNRRAFQTAGNPITMDNLWNRETYLEKSNTAMTSWTHTFSPRLFAETVGTVTLIDWQYSLNQPSAKQDISAQLGTPNPFSVNGAPFLQNLGYNAVQFHGIVPRSQYTKVYSIEQNYTWVRQAHQIEFGGRFRQENLDTIPDRPNQSTLNFDSLATSVYNTATGTAYGALPQTGDNAANFFLGIATSYQQSRPPGNYNMHGKDESLYVQDNWKVRHDLTLNLGLRWEYLGPYIDGNGMTSVWDFPSKSLVKNVSIAQLVKSGYTTQPIADGYAGIGVKWTTPDKVGLPFNMVSVGKHDFAPRAGFAYNTRIGRRDFVLRGGYGLYHFPIPARTFSELRLNPPLQGSYSFSWNNAQQTADGLPNYFMRFAPTVIAGANSTNALNINEPPTVLPGVQITGLSPNLETSRAHEWNLVLETEVMRNTVVRASWIGTAGRDLEMMQLFNTNPISNYVWYVNSRQPLPTGFYSNTARRTFDQTTYGDIRIYSKTGYSNFNGIQLEAERRYSRGLAFQLFYLMSNSASTGATPSQGGDFTVNAINQPDRFLPGAMPDDLEKRIRFYRYSRDTDVPKHRVRWNLLVDLPFGRGKTFFGDVGSKLDRVVGGWQVAAYGTAQSRYWSLPTGNWGTLGTPETYGTQNKIQDCRSGTCIPGYLYYNGYIPANRINVAGGVMGVPQNYKPSSQPIFPTPADGGSPTDPNRSNYETNNVFVQLSNGTNQLVAYDTGLHPWRNQPRPGPWLSSSNASLYKSVPITEQVALRISLDAFNVFNQPGLVLPDPNTGILSLRTSAQGARTLQYTARLTW